MQVESCGGEEVSRQVWGETGVEINSVEKTGLEMWRETAVEINGCGGPEGGPVVD